MRGTRDGAELARVSDDSGTLVCRACSIPERSVSTFLHDRPAPRTVWDVPGEPTIATAGAAVAVSATGQNRFRTVREAAATLFAGGDRDQNAPAVARPRLLGGVAFHANHADAPPWTGFPAASFILPQLQYVRTDTEAFLVAADYGLDPDPATVEARLDAAADDLTSAPGSEPSAVPSVQSIERTVSRPAWHEQVETALSRIDSGALQKVVLAQSLDASLTAPIDPTHALERLRERNPGCARFLVSPTGDATLFGATPERLVSLSGRQVETGALGGSSGRGDTPDEDAALETALRESGKDQHEHALVVEEIRSQLDPFAASISVGTQQIRQLESVQHLQTPISARLTADEHVLTLVEALHPTPAVGGLPQAAAQETIRTVEPFDRGWYAAPVGWFDAAGNGSFAVAIRSSVAAGQTATLYAGAGIVQGSDPDAEWDEVQLKYRPILDALEA